MNKKPSDVCVIGLGYIGLPTAALLSQHGYHVHGVDISQHVVDTINKGEIHIVEPELDLFVKRAVENKKLQASPKPEHADVFIIAVPTPFHDGYKPNIEYVLSATRSIAPYVKPGNLIILESTSPVGTTEKVAEELRNLGVDTDNLNIAYCPERVLPGKIMKELVENDRIVGGLNEISTNAVVAFYKTFVQGEVLSTDARTAELCKLTENSYRDVNIAFANELSLICDKAGINVWELIRLANHHPRVNILQPGVGVGGHCIAVDPWFLVSDFPEVSKMIRSGREVNDFKTEWVISRISADIVKFSHNHNRTPIVGLLGLTFKPDIDDLRESPALHIARVISGRHQNVICVEPNVISADGLVLEPLEKVIDSADLIFKLVRHKEFLNLSQKEGRQIFEF